MTAGSLTTIFGKVMDQKVMLPSTAARGGEANILMAETEFKHPLFMNLLMFMGEASLLLVLHLQLRADPIAAAAHAKNKASPLLFVLPALLDTCGSFLNFTGLSFISASSYQILKMLSMVFIFGLSKLFFRRSYMLG